MLSDNPKEYQSIDGEDLKWMEAVEFTSSSSEKTESEILDVFSNFGDVDCGQPSRPQMLTIDFTPDPEMDTDENQKKCCEFWEFIRSQPSLAKLLVIPEEMDTAEEQGEAGTSETSSTTTIKEEPTAITVLERDSLGAVKMTVGAKMPASACAQGCREYVEGDRTAAPQPKEQANGCDCTEPCEPVCLKCFQSVEEARGKAAAVGRVLDEWNKQHPTPYSGNVYTIRPLRHGNILEEEEDF